MMLARAYATESLIPTWRILPPSRRWALYGCSCVIIEVNHLKALSSPRYLTTEFRWYPLYQPGFTALLQHKSWYAEVDSRVHVTYHNVTVADF
jgi:hypothetical protein